MKNQRQRGSALFLALVAIAIVAGLITTGMIVLLNSDAVVRLELRTEAQAISIAQAGLAEALSWFRRHPTDAEFNPQRDFDADPPINDTADPSMGIVREFQITENLWGRYEVRKVGLHKVKDISDLKCYSDAVVDGHVVPNGSAWLLYAVGIMFEKRNEATYQTTDFYFSPEPLKPASEEDKKYCVCRKIPDPDQPGEYIIEKRVVNQDAVKVVSRAVVGTEIRRFNFVLPGGNGAAVCAFRGNRVTVGSHGRVQALIQPGILYPAGTGTPNTSGGEVYGDPPRQTMAWVEESDKNSNGVMDDFEVEYVFPKMQKTDLKGMADIFTTDYTTLPSPFPNYSLVYVEGDAIFTPDKNLVGTGILFVDGNLTIEPSANPNYRGLIYVTGVYTQGAPSLISGAIIACGWADSNGNGKCEASEAIASVQISGIGDYSEANFDADILQRVKENMSNYRFSRSMYLVK